MAVTTVKEMSTLKGRDAAGPRPALVIVHAEGQPRYTVVEIPVAPHQAATRSEDATRELELGRDGLLALGIQDERVSRRHLLVQVAGTDVTIADRGSSNGTFVDGKPLTAPWSGEVRAAPSSGAMTATPRVIRIGRTLMLLVPDVQPHLDPGLKARGDLVVAPAVGMLHRHLAALARAGHGVLLMGETGTGKEVAARTYHEAGPHPGGPFVAVNCATVPQSLAERLLFGARRGAYSGATHDAPGYLQAADGGTLFLDEIGELDLVVQAKLLRVLETREVTMLGDTRARPVDIRVCTATLRDLRAEVAAGRFREDLYFRVGPEVRLPPLRDWPEAIPWLIAHVLRAASHAPVEAALGFVERCLLLPWPGNVRQLVKIVQAAAVAVAAGGQRVVEEEQLEAVAGPLTGAAPPPTGAAASPAAAPAPPLDMTGEERALHAALVEERGNVKRAADRAGVSRSKLRRFIEKHRIDPDRLR